MITPGVLDIYWKLAPDSLKKLDLNTKQLAVDLPVKILNDVSTQISAITLTGITEKNTFNWKLYGTIDTGVLYLYKDKAKLKLVAQSSGGTIIEQNNSGITGTITLITTVLQDENIVLMKVQGTFGEFRRYLLSMSDENQDDSELISGLTDLWYWKKMPLSYIRYIFEAFEFPYLEAWDEKFKRYLLSELFNISRYTGTEGVIRFILYKFYGWKLLFVDSLQNSAFFFNLLDSITYDGLSSDPTDYRRYFDPDIMSPVQQVIIRIKHFSDPEFADKKDSVEIFLRRFIPGILEPVFDYIP